MKGLLPVWVWSVLMPKPSDMLPRRDPFEIPGPDATRLLQLADHAVLLVNYFKRAGMRETTALALADVTLGRFDEERSTGY